MFLPACVKNSVHSGCAWRRGHAWQGVCMVEVCMAGGCVWQRGMHGREGVWQRGHVCRRDGHWSGWYAFYWNAFLFMIVSCHTLLASGMLHPRLKPHQCLYVCKYMDRKCHGHNTRDRQVWHQSWIWGIHCTHVIKYASDWSILPLKLRADITRSPKQGYQRPHKKNWCNQNFFGKKTSFMRSVIPNKNQAKPTNDFDIEYSLHLPCWSTVDFKGSLYLRLLSVVQPSLATWYS